MEQPAKDKGRLFGRLRDRLTFIVVKDEKIRPNVMLKYYLDLSGTDYLHWGYWRDLEGLSLRNFQLAQERYVDHLIEFIPPGIKKILDVGCGVGGNAKKLKEKGYQVTGLSPDPYQEQLFKERTGRRIPFFLSTFEDYRPDTRFDLILMSESVQYIPLEQCFSKAKEILPEGGYLLTSDYYRLENSRNIKEQHLPSMYLQDYIKGAAANGFQIVKEEDISKEVLPTLHYGQMLFSRYIRPTLSAQMLALQVHLPIGYKLLKRCLRFKIKGEPVESIIRNNLVPLKPEVFERYMKYMIFLFEKRSNT